MTQAIDPDTCRYCSRQIGDAFSGGPDDVAPGVCAECLRARMAALMLGAMRRAEHATTLEDLNRWLRAELVELGVAPVWAQRFIDLDFAAMDAAGERLHA